jgi:hypothetical protein
MKGFKVFTITTSVLIIMSNIAEESNSKHHRELALMICGSQDAIAEVNSSRFTCVN